MLSAHVNFRSVLATVTAPLAAAATVFAVVAIVATGSVGVNTTDQGYLVGITVADTSTPYNSSSATNRISFLQFAVHEAAL